MATPAGGPQAFHHRRPYIPRKREDGSLELFAVPGRSAVTDESTDWSTTEKALSIRAGMDELNAMMKGAGLSCMQMM